MSRRTHRGLRGSRPKPEPIFGERVYRALLAAYPAEFRELFGPMMLDFYRERLARAAATSSRWALAMLRLRLYADVVVHGVAERVAPLRSRNSASHASNPIRGDAMMLPNATHDVAYATRSLRRSAGFTTTVLLTLALGIAGSVAIFSVVNGVLLRPLPFWRPDRLIQLSYNDSPSMVSAPELTDLEHDAHKFISLGAYSYADGNVTGGGADPERIRMVRANAGFFRTLAPTLAVGRAYTSDEERAGGPDIVVIGYGLWQRRFGMDGAIVGRRIVINDVPRTIVGVTPRDFDYPAGNIAAYVPLRLDADAAVTRTRSNHYLRVVGRLANHVSVREADAEVRTLRDGWAKDFPESYSAANPLHIDVRPIRDRILGATEPYLIALLGAVGFVLLIVCVNVANLLLARGEMRRREVSIRRALGATRGRIAMQLSIESALLALGGGALGTAAAWPLLRMIVSAAPASIPRAGEIRIDTSALVFAVGVCVATGFLFALAPIVQGARQNLLALNSGSRYASRTHGHAGRRTRSLLVSSEVALAVMLLAGASLFLRSLYSLQRTELGFSADSIVTARISLPRPGYDEARATRFIAALVQRARTLPGVSSAAAMAWTPIVDGGGNWSLVAEGTTRTSDAEAPTAVPQQVTPGFFRTMRIPIRSGREFTDADRDSTPPVIIVNEALARKVWGTTDVIGRRLRMTMNGMPWMTIVGVVGDTRVDGLTEPAPAGMYFPHRQAGTSGYFTASSMTLLVRTTGSMNAVAPAIRQLVRELDPNVPVSEMRTMRDVVASTIARHRFTTLLLAGLAAVAVALSAIGIFGIIAYSVAQRRYELGVRMALGAGRRRMLSLVLREGLSIVTLGVAVGIAGAMALGRVLRSMLVGVGAVDPMTLATVSVLIFLVALCALAIPARRAMSLDPTEALRAG